jgi:hypothetical protein
MASAARARLAKSLFFRAASSSAPGGGEGGLNLLSGAPVKHLVRTVRIFRPAKYGRHSRAPARASIGVGRTPRTDR